MNLAVDLTDLATFADGIPHDLFARLRAEQPVAWQPTTYVPGFWALTRYDDVVAVNRDPKTFSSARGAMLWDTPGIADPDAPRMMIESDPPRHTRLRLLVNRGFTPRMIGRLEDFVRRVAVRTIEDARELGSFDFVELISSRLPMEVIAELLGVPPADQQHVYELSNRIAGFSDPEYGEVTGGSAISAVRDIRAYATALGATKRADLDADHDDIVSALLRDLDGEELSDAEFSMFVQLLAIAGNETTRTAISQALLGFFEHPEQWARLQTDPALLPSAVEEILRYTTPILHMRRTATCDTEVGGQAIAEGDHVVLWYASANFDERAFADPRTFDVGRSPNEHVTFGGGGPHYCLGAHLARLEIRVMFEELLARMPDLEPAGPIARLRSNFTNGIKRMPVRLVG
jgi:cholest-4-en-3-one 26-monooxygenase